MENYLFKTIWVGIAIIFLMFLSFYVGVQVGSSTAFDSFPTGWSSYAPLDGCSESMPLN
jgi:uncharacterized membrane protein YczE